MSTFYNTILKNLYRSIGIAILLLVGALLAREVSASPVSGQLCWNNSGVCGYSCSDGGMTWVYPFNSPDHGRKVMQGESITFDVKRVSAVLAYNGQTCTNVQTKWDRVRCDESGVYCTTIGTTYIPQPKWNGSDGFTPYVSDTDWDWTYTVPTTLAPGKYLIGTTAKSEIQSGVWMPLETHFFYEHIEVVAADPIPACGVTCAKDSDCQGAKDGCTACIAGASGTKTCKTPPACNVKCSSDFDCASAKDGCTTCIADTTGNKTCKTPTLTSTPTVTPSSILTPLPTNPPSLSPSPTPTISPPPGTTIPPATSNTPTPTRPAGATSTPPQGASATPSQTPTPPFSTAACKCDGIEYTALFSGQPATITSFGKVEGADVSKAQIVNQSFFLAEGAETTATIISRSGPVPATVVSQTPTLVRYKSDWQFTVPQLKSGATYRIWSQINCQPRTTVFNTSPSGNISVLAGETQNMSLLDRIIEFFAKLLGKSKETAPAIEPTATPFISDVSTNEVAQPTGRKQLQIGTLYPFEVYQKTCSFIKFRTGLN